MVVFAAVPAAGGAFVTACGSDEAERRRPGFAFGTGGSSAECAVDEDCPGPRGECGGSKCHQGVCVLDNRPMGDVCQEGGGSVCDGAGTCVECALSKHCSSGVCVAHLCVSTSCSDGAKNGQETGVDCGGGCPTKCPAEAGCASDADCSGGACDPVLKTCSSSCSDGAQNGGETDLDCGGPCPLKCAIGLHCSVNIDCASMNCTEGHCFP